MQLLPDLDDESVVASEVLVDKRDEEVGGVELRVVVDVQVEEAARFRRRLDQVPLVADQVAPLLRQEPRSVAPVLEDHPVHRQDPKMRHFQRL